MPDPGCQSNTAPGEAPLDTCPSVLGQAGGQLAWCSLRGRSVLWEGQVPMGSALEETGARHGNSSLAFVYL